MLFDDISDNFTGIGKTYSLTVGGANTSSGIGIGNGVLFLNGVFQTPLTTNNVEIIMNLLVIQLQVYQLLNLLV